MAETPSGYQGVPEDQQKRALEIFKKAKSSAAAGQFDFAISLYLSGLEIDPEAVEAHQELREVSFKRMANGGKSLGMFEKLKYLKPSRDHKQNMLNSERVLAHQPGDLDAMEKIFVSAHKAGFYDTVLWAGPILFKANQDAKKPDYNKFIVQKDIYKDIQQWDRAIDACREAAKAKPDDMDLGTEFKHLSAEEAMRRGNYHQAGRVGGFRAMLRNADAQQQLIDAQKDVVSENLLDRRIREAEEQLKADPAEAGKMQKLVDALIATEQMDNENRAIEMLTEWYDKTRQFRFRKRAGEVGIKQFTRMLRGKIDEAKANPTDAGLQKELQSLQKEKLEYELNEFMLWIDNYPTDGQIRFDIGKRMAILKRYDEAIPVLQQATTDPKFKIEASIWLGKSFLNAGFPDEAVEVLERTIGETSTADENRMLDLHYTLGRAMEDKGDMEGALKNYSRVMQIKFGYMDTQVRVKRLREQLRGKPAAE